MNGSPMVGRSAEANHRYRRPMAIVATVSAVVGGGVLLPVGAAGADIPGTEIITDPIGSATGFAWDKIEEGITGWVLAALGRVAEELGGFMAKTADADPTAAWFAGPDSPFASVRLIAGGLLCAFVLAGLIQGLLSGDAGGMLRRMALTLPLAALAIGVTLEVTSFLLRLTDALAAGVLGPSGGQVGQFLGGFGAAAASVNGGFAAVAIALFCIGAALAIWVELIVRTALVYLLVALSPLAFATMVWPSARGVARRLVELSIAVIVSKLAIAIALAIGVAALAGAGEAGTGEGIVDGTAASLGTLMVGATVLALGAFAPFVVLRLVPVAEAALVAQGISRSPVRAAHTVAAAAVTTHHLGRLVGPSPSATAAPVITATAGGRLAAPAPSSSPTFASSAPAHNGTDSGPRAPA